jgi:hypothetical protein
MSYSFSKARSVFHSEDMGIDDSVSKENEMTIQLKKASLSWAVACVTTGLLIASADGRAAEGVEWSERNPVTGHLTGEKEVPPVTTKASGKSTIKITKNRLVTGMVKVEDLSKPTMAHIHQGPLDKDGPVIITLKKTDEKTFTVPPDTKLTEEQYAAFKEGNLYINVHTEKYPSGEIRAQMKP